MTAHYKGISLFTGCGGMDLGFSQEGFSFGYGMEADPNAVETYNANNRSKARLTKITAATKIESDLDIVVAGPPCQGFSTAGGYKKSDPRNELLAITCSITTKAKPKVIVIENVSGLTNSVNSDTLACAVNILRQANYFVDMRIVECEKHGVPQRRRRLFVVARSEGREFSLADIPQKPRVLIKDVLSNSLEPDNPDIDKSIALVPNSKEWHIVTAIKVDNVRYPIVDLNPGYCASNCETIVLPGQEILGYIPYSDFNLPSTEFLKDKRLEYEIYGFACHN